MQVIVPVKWVINSKQFRQILNNTINEENINNLYILLQLGEIRIFY